MSLSELHGKTPIANVLTQRHVQYQCSAVLPKEWTECHHCPNPHPRSRLQQGLLELCFGSILLRRCRCKGRIRDAQREFIPCIFSNESAHPLTVTNQYDRLGTGKSDHPDPVQVVQTPLEVAIAKELIHILRKGKIASTSFKHVVSVGHSFGSIITQGITAESPELLDAAVLTGFSTSGTGQPAFFSGLDFTIARHTPPKRFKGLNNGYIVAANSIGNQFAFLRAQGFPPRNLDVAEATKDTITFGELFNLTQPIARATSYTGPVDVVNGDADFAFCQGNCRVPVNQAANVLTALYPNASKKSQYYLADNAGHGLNAHYTAPKAYAQIMKFIKSNGL